MVHDHLGRALCGLLVVASLAAPLDGVAWGAAALCSADAHRSGLAFSSPLCAPLPNAAGARCGVLPPIALRVQGLPHRARDRAPANGLLAVRAVAVPPSRTASAGGNSQGRDGDGGRDAETSPELKSFSGWLTSGQRIGSLGAESEASWPDMRNMGKIRDECKALLAESREVILRDFELAKSKWETALDTVEKKGEPAYIVTTYNLVLNLCALAAARGRPDALETALDVMSRMVERGATPNLVSFNTLMNVCAKSAAAGLGEQAVVNAHAVLNMMEESNIQPDAITFTSMLDACARAAAVRGGRGGWTRGWKNGLEVLDLMRQRGVGRTAMTYNVLIATCVTGASMRREGLWVQEAVDLAVGVLTTMRQDGVRPDSDTYNHLFTVCAKAAGAGYKGAAAVAQEVFADMQEEGLAVEMGVETWNALVNTYAKCANFSLAQRLVSVEMPAAGVVPDLITWNTVMHAVANEAARGRLSGLQYGMHVLEMMKASAVQPDVRSYNSLLRACTATAWGRGSDTVRPRGAWVMDLMRADGVEPDLITFTTILDACVRAARDGEDGGRGEAMLVLQEMQKAGLAPNVVTCNCLLSACAKAAHTHGLVMIDNGLELLQQMKTLGVAPDIISFNTLISACSYAASSPQAGYRAGDALARGLQLMREMQSHGVTPNVISFTSLLSAGARAIKNEGDATVVQQARALVSLMRDLGVRADVVTYTTIMDIYAKAAAQGQPGDWVTLSLQVLEDMRAASVAPNGITCSVLVDTCVNSVDMLQGDSKGRSAQKRIRRIFSRLDRDGDGRITANELVEASSLLQDQKPRAEIGGGGGGGGGGGRGRISSAPRLEMYNVTSADVMRFMRAADKDGDGTISYSEFEHLIVDSTMPRGLGVLPKMGTERAVAEGRGFITVAWKIMCDMLNLGIAVNVNACNALLDATVVVAGLGPMGKGEETFDVCFEDASKIFWMMDKYAIGPNCRSYTALIKLCALGAANGVGERAIEKAYFLLDRMRERGIAADVVVFNTLVDAYAKAAWACPGGGGIGRALQVLDMMRGSNVQPNTVTYTSLINAARHEGTHEAVTVALALFRKMPAISRNHQTYTVMMHALTRVGRKREALALVDEASSHGLQPNSFMLDAAVQAAGGDKRLVRMLEDRFSAQSQQAPRLVSRTGPNRAALPQRDDSAGGRRGWSEVGRNEAPLVNPPRQGSGGGLEGNGPRQKSRGRQGSGGPRPRRGRQGSAGGARDSSRAAVHTGGQVQSRTGKMGDLSEILVREQGHPPNALIPPRRVAGRSNDSQPSRSVSRDNFWI